MKIIIIFFIFSLILIPLTTNSFSQEVETRFTNDPIVTLETTHGNISIEFFPQDAPNHVQNFITLTNQGFYDGTLFHRVIPNFMIQGGDPNTIDGDPSTWGQGGPDTRIDAEFNSIKHNRGIVSMARSADVNSAGSQFFIVHANSNFLDGDYTAFGRIVTEESFETIDTISELSIGYRDVPQDEVKIIKASITSRLNTPNLLKLSEPERTESTITPPTGKQIFESKELNVSFSAPEGWLLQQPENIPGAPDVAVVGPKQSGINPVISLTIDDVNNKTIDDLITEKNNVLAEAVYENKLEILSQQLINSNVYQIEAVGNFKFLITKHHLLHQVTYILTQLHVSLILIGKYLYQRTNLLSNQEIHVFFYQMLEFLINTHFSKLTKLRILKYLLPKMLQFQIFFQ